MAVGRLNHRPELPIGPWTAGRPAGSIRWVRDPMAVDRLLSSRYRFRCRQAGLRLADEERLRVDVSVAHLVRQPFPSVVAWAPPSLQVVYQHTDGAALFCPDGATLDDLGTSYGFILHAVGDVPAETDRLRGWLLADLDDLRDELNEAEYDKARHRINGFVTIGSTCSGDPLVLDQGSASEDANEVPVILLDHELLLFAAIDGSDGAATVYPDIVGFLTAWDLDPLACLGDSWRYHDPEGRQYFTESAARAP